MIDKEQEEKSSYLGLEPIPKLLLKQALPAAIGFMVMSMNMIVDTYFVGQFIGELAIGAISVVFPHIFSFFINWYVHWNWWWEYCIQIIRSW